MLREYNTIEEKDMLTFELDDELVDKLEEIAEERSMPVDELIAEILELFISENYSDTDISLVFE